jgi:hypothetical protein
MGSGGFFRKSAENTTEKYLLSPTSVLEFSAVLEYYWSNLSLTTVASSESATIRYSAALWTRSPGIVMVLTYQAMIVM